MEQNYKIEIFKGEASEIALLFQSEYTLDNSLCKAEYLDWQYFKNPIGDAIIICTREVSKNEVVAVYIVNPVLYNFKGKLIKGALSLNTFTRKDFRGLGLFPKMANLCYQTAKNMGHEFIIGFPNPASYSGFVKKLGFTDIGDVPFYVKFPNIISTGLKKLGLISQKNVIKKFDTISKSSNLAIQELTEIDKDKLDVFFKSYSKQSFIQNEKSFDTLKWRYLTHPIKEYSIIGVLLEGKIIGLAIISIQKNNWMLDGLLIDFMLLEESKNISYYSYFTKQMLKYFKYNRVDTVKAYVNKATLEFKVLSKFNFFTKSTIAKDANIPFIFKHLNQESVSNVNEWNIVLGDCDVV